VIISSVVYYLYVEAPSSHFFFGNVAIYPLFIVPVLFGKKCPWLQDWCGPIQFLAKMTIMTVHFVYND